MKKWLDKYQSKGEVKKGVYQYTPQNLVNPNFNGLATTTYNVTPTNNMLPEVVIKAKRIKKQQPSLQLPNQMFASNTREKTLEDRRNYYFPYETEQTKKIRDVADDYVFRSSGDLISSVHPIGAIINALTYGADKSLPAEGLRYLPNKIPFKQAIGYNKLMPILKPASKLIDPIQMFDKLHIADSLYKSADSIDLYNQFKEGGLTSKNSLNRKVTCSNCGWSWKLSDGGMDPMTCHKCGGDIKMREGGELDQYQSKGEVKQSFRDQLFQRNKPIVDKTAAPILLPPNLNYDKTRVVNSSSRGLNKTQLKNINQNLRNRAEQEKKQELEEYRAAQLFHNNNPVAKLLGTRSAPVSSVKPTARELAYGLGAGINEFYDIPGIGIVNDFVNPLSVVSKGIISPWAQAPLQAQQSDSYLPYLGAAASTALTIGDVAMFGPYVKGLKVPKPTSISSSVDDVVPKQAGFLGDVGKNIVNSGNYLKNEARLSDDVIEGLMKSTNTITGKGRQILNDLSSPEGIRRLKQQFRLANPALNDQQLDYLVVTRLNEVNDAINFNQPEFMLTHGRGAPGSPTEGMLEHYYPQDNAHWSSYNPHPNVQNVEAPETLFPKIKSLQNQGVLNLQKTTGYEKFTDPNYFPGSISLGTGFEDNVMVLDHEIGHSIQKGGVMPIDDELRALLPAKRNWADRMFDRFTLDKKGILESRGDKSYFDFAGGRTYKNESYPFLVEQRRKMIEKGILKDRYDKVTPLKLLKAKISASKNTRANFLEGDRLINFTPFWKYPQLAKIMNKAPAAVPVVGAATAIANSNEKKKKGGVIKDNRGQWAHPGKITEINSNQITMQGVPYPVMGVDNTGHTKMMQPGMDYTFPGQYVTEYPMMQSGGQMIKRADGSYSRPGLWDNIRKNAGSGKKPTAQMLEQERKIRNKYQEGGSTKQNPPKEYTDYKAFKKAERMYNDSNFIYNQEEKYNSFIKNLATQTYNPFKRGQLIDAFVNTPDFIKNIDLQKKMNYNLNQGDFYLYTDRGKDYTTVPTKPVQPVVYQPQQTVNTTKGKVTTNSPQTVSSQHGKSGMWGNEYDKKHPPIYVTNPKDPRIGQYGKDGNQYLYKEIPKPTPAHPINKMKRLSMINQYLDNPNIQMQGQTIPLPKMKLPQQGNPIYGPGNTIIGYNNNMHFTPAPQYTGAPNNEFNLQDKALLDNPELLKQYIYNRDSGYHYQGGGQKDKYWRTGLPMVNDPSMDAISKVLLYRNQDKNFMQRAAGFGYQGGGEQNNNLKNINLNLPVIRHQEINPLHFNGFLVNDRNQNLFIGGVNPRYQNENFSVGPYMIGVGNKYFQKFPADMGVSGTYHVNDNFDINMGVGQNNINAGIKYKFNNGGYVVRRSHDRKGKTHVVTGPDGTKKYFGDPNMGERGNSKYGKEAFYARHKSNLAKNPYFRAYARTTWQEGGQKSPDMEYASNYIYRYPATTFPCQGKGCSEQVSNELVQMGLTPQRTDAWFMNDSVQQSGGKEIWNQKNNTPVDYKNIRVGDIISLDRPGLHYINKKNKKNKYKPEMDVEHVGVIVGFNENGVPLVKHGGADENTVVQPINDIFLNVLSTGIKLNYNPYSIYRLAGADTFIPNQKYYDKYYEDIKPVLEKIQPLDIKTDKLTLDKEKFVSALNNNLEKQSRVLGISPNDVQQLQKIAYGIFGNESTFNESQSRNIKEPIKRIFHGLNLTDNSPSLGVTRLKYDDLVNKHTTKVAKIFSDLGVKKNKLQGLKSDLEYNDEANATVGLLGYYFNKLKEKDENGNYKYNFNPKTNTVFDNVPIGIAVASIYNKPGGLKNYKKRVYPHKAYNYIKEDMTSFPLFQVNLDPISIKSTDEKYIDNKLKQSAIELPENLRIPQSPFMNISSRNYYYKIGGQSTLNPIVKKDNRNWLDYLKN
jgi:hypothetical protein